MSALLSLMVPGATPPGPLDGLRTVGRPVEWIAASTRNQSVRAARGDLCAFQPDGQPLDGSFLEQACRLLDQRSELALVTGFGDRVPAALGGEPAQLGETALLARPMSSHVPTVFRRAAWEQVGGFDESLPAGQELDLWLRVVDVAPAVVIETALPSGRALFDAAAPEADWGPFWARHAHRLQRCGRAVLLAKERIFRELERRARVVHLERQALECLSATLEQREASLARR